MIGKIISHYKILEKIGEGGRGVVYKAEDLKLKRIVALKFLSPHLIANKIELNRLISEAQSASALNHTNITTIYEIGESGIHTFIAMEYIHGETLKSKLKGGLLTNQETYEIAIAIAKGLQEAHGKDIIHRDIKSDNIMISESGDVKIMDFGLAKSKDDGGFTKVGTTMGTLTYMSPEQIEGLVIDQRADIYSLGIVMYEMITGRLPFIGEHEAAVLYSIVNEQPPLISSLNIEAEQKICIIIEKAIQKKSSKRHNDINELIHELEIHKTDKQTGLVYNILSKYPLVQKIIRIRRRYWLIPVTISLLAILAFSSLWFDSNSSFVDKIEYEKSLAVLNFDNIQQPDDPERLGQILQELVIADLSDIQNLKIFSSQRLFDIQKQLGSPDRTKIDPSLATRIAQKADANTMLTGNIIKTNDSLILNSQLINIEDGSIIASQRVEGNNIYDMVDELTAQIHNDLELPLLTDASVDVAVSEKTSSSVDAFQYYFSGVDYFNDSRFDDAIMEFDRAITIDSTFSQAYYKLALAQWWSQSEMGDQTISDAKKSLEHILSASWYTTTKEKLLAKGAMALINYNFVEAEEIYKQILTFIPDEKEAWYGIGEAIFHGKQNFEESFDAFEKAVALDPTFTIAYRHIFDVYALREEYDIGIVRASQLISLNPENAWGHIFLGNMLKGKEQRTLALNSYKKAIQLNSNLPIIYTEITKIYLDENRFDDGISFANQVLDRNVFQPGLYHLLAKMYLGKNDIQSAIRSYRDGLEIKPECFELETGLAYQFQLMGDYDKVLTKYKEIENKYPEYWNSKGKYLLSNIYLEQGRYNDLIKILESKNNQMTEADINIQSNILNSLALTTLLLGNTDKALVMSEKVLLSDITLQTRLSTYMVQCRIYTEKNNLNQVELIAETVKDSVRSQAIGSIYHMFNNAIQFNLHFGKGDFENALKIYELMDKKWGFKDRYHYEVGLAYLALNQPHEVFKLVKEMRSPLISSNIRSYIYPRSYYLEGLAFERLGNTVSAINSYRSLLDIWKNGDREAPEYQETLQHLNHINN